jgi:formiminotetrahydrofolate cyclodeaminase
VTHETDDSPESWNLEPFLEAVASKRVAPAGGSVVGIVGAAGTALLEMAAIHTLEHRPADDLEAARATLAHQRDTLQSLATADARVVEDLFGGEKRGIETSLVDRATGIPLTMAEACTNALDAAQPVAEQVVDSVRPDLVTGITFVVAAARTATWIVRSNLESIGDEARVQDLAGRVDELLEILAGHVVRLQTTLAVELPLSSRNTGP